jgi:hypothetical protein
MASSNAQLSGDSCSLCPRLISLRTRGTTGVLVVGGSLASAWRTCGHFRGERVGAARQAIAGSAKSRDKLSDCHLHP